MRSANQCHFTHKNNNPWRNLLWKRLSIHLSDILKCQKIIFAFRHIFLSVLTGILKWFSRRDFHKNALQLRLTTPKATHSLANLRLVRGFCQFLSVIISQNCCEYDCIQRIQWFVCSGGSWYHRNWFLVTVISGIKRSIVHVIHPTLPSYHAGFQGISKFATSKIEKLAFSQNLFILF